MALLVRNTTADLASFNVTAGLGFLETELAVLVGDCVVEVLIFYKFPWFESGRRIGKILRPFTLDKIFFSVHVPWASQDIAFQI